MVAEVELSRGGLPVRSLYLMGAKTAKVAARSNQYLTEGISIRHAMQKFVSKIEQKRTGMPWQTLSVIRLLKSHIIAQPRQSRKWTRVYIRNFYAYPRQLSVRARSGRYHTLLYQICCQKSSSQWQIQHHKSGPIIDSRSWCQCGHC